MTRRIEIGLPTQLFDALAVSPLPPCSRQSEPKICPQFQNLRSFGLTRHVLSPLASTSYTRRAHGPWGAAGHSYEPSAFLVKQWLWRHGLWRWHAGARSPEPRIRANRVVVLR